MSKTYNKSQTNNHSTDFKYITWACMSFQSILVIYAHILESEDLQKYNFV